MLLIYIALALVTLVHGQGDGGFGCDIKESMQLDRQLHGEPQSSDPPFVMKIFDENNAHTKFYQPGRVYSVRLTGSVPYRLILIEARQADATGTLNGTHTVGQFVPQPEWATFGVKGLKCGNADSEAFPKIDAITHVTEGKKFVLKIDWTVTEDVGPVQFVVTIAQERDIYWELWRPRFGLLLPTPEIVADPVEFKVAPEVRSIGDNVQTAPTTTVEQTTTTTTSTTPKVETEKPMIPENFFVLPTRKFPTTTTDLTTTTETVEGSGEQDVESNVTIGLISDLETDDYEQPRIEATRGGAPDEEEPISLILLGANATQNATTETPALTTTINTQALNSGGDKQSLQVPQIDLKRLEFGKDNFPDVSTQPPPVTFAPPQPCRFNPCRNGGRCEPINELIAIGEPAFTCVCAVGFVGRLCQSADFCLNTTCEHGTCSNSENGASCDCQAGWGGALCNHPCPSYFCENGGKCKIFEDGQYGCDCKPGYAGRQCNTQANECEPNPCQNGGTCTDKFADYECKCADGFGGRNCERPCLDIYETRCKVWAYQGLCELANATNFFRENCESSCKFCNFHPSTVPATLPIPPALKTVAFLIGEWEVERSYDNVLFPVDFPKSVPTYTEKLNISVADHLYLGLPALRIRSIAVSNTDPQIVKESQGFITVSMKVTGQDMVSVTTTTNEGVTTIEEGIVTNGSLALTPQYVGGPPDPQVTAIIDTNVERTFEIDSIWLRQRVTHRVNNLEFPTSKYYARAKKDV